ncbi:Autoinducer 2-binding protein LsrB precursor [Planctomycetes bacterium Pan216]|uniref:Autoinducer 2-binding protein LsrB n=1 Tax=Kolteria novifilia TaxID=2527975 RepID=A0A518AWU3_9BACT|nr:Autoinducer 2-binding protein LsrB precursor [Planctomycetes bacterium Pan216]
MPRLPSRLVRLLILGCLGTAAGCGAGSDAPTTEPVASKRLVMGMMPKLVGIPYFNACERGAREAADELGIDLVFDGPQTDSADQQAAMIDLWIGKGFDIIAIAPNDPVRVAPALKRAREAGILVVTFDADADETASGRDLFVNQASAESIGNSLVDVLAEGIGGKGTAVIVTGTATAANLNDWIAIMKRRLKEHYPEIELLPTLVPNEDQNRARQMTADVLNAHPELDGILGITSLALPAVAESVAASGRSGEIFVTGLSLPNVVRPYLENGTVKKFVLWNPVDLGYLTVAAAKQLAEKKLNNGVQPVGRLKDVDVSEDTVILGPPIIFDETNVELYDF